MPTPTNDHHDVGSLFLFSGVTEHTLGELLKTVPPQTVSYGKGQTVFSSEQDTERLGFVLRGSCRVLMCRSSCTDIALNTLKAGDSFGILSLFHEGEYPTKVVACEPTRILFFTKSDIYYMIEHVPTVSLALLRFFAGRVDFLNKKLRTLTGKDTEAKLAAWLLLAAPDEGVPFAFHATRAAEALGCGRASLYRALESLAASDAITYSERKIKIINKKFLERIST